MRIVAPGQGAHHLQCCKDRQIPDSKLICLDLIHFQVIFILVQTNFPLVGGLWCQQAMTATNGQLFSTNIFLQISVCLQCSDHKYGELHNTDPLKCCLTVRQGNKCHLYKKCFFCVCMCVRVCNASYTFDSLCGILFLVLTQDNISF